MALLSILAFIAVMLTWTMFSSRERMLGFPCVIFWALLGGQAYTLSTIPWGDIYYYIAFSSLLGMTTFTALGAYGLREKRDTIADEELEKGGDRELIDEQKRDDYEEIFSSGIEEKPSRRTRKLRERAKGRRNKWE